MIRSYCTLTLHKKLKLRKYKKYHLTRHKRVYIANLNSNIREVLHRTDGILPTMIAMVVDNISFSNSAKKLPHTSDKNWLTAFILAEY